MNAAEVERRIDRAQALLWSLAMAHDSPHMMERDQVDLMLSMAREQLTEAKRALDHAPA
ncbi:hypothetical protein [Sinimarinibacterium flocculans]|uniref:hypothetical protein n=1 Tax=Sinimarinibacterium flocculans TaxID=985250 RepID=UPI0035125B8C